MDIGLPARCARLSIVTQTTRVLSTSNAEAALAWADVFSMGGMLTLTELEAATGNSGLDWDNDTVSLLWSFSHKINPPATNAARASRPSNGQSASIFNEADGGAPSRLTDPPL